jgi:hypothetical protein|tara:strand:+ start:9 stop:590 length:582 start_codon:yes stop_codon:yes gene_type:complete
MSKTTIPTAGLADDAVDLTSKVTGTLPTANGGTGATSFTAGITMADAWRVTSNFTTDNLDPIASNWERNDNNFDKIGTGMSNSSGVFTFPSTGIYSIKFETTWQLSGETGYTFAKIRFTSDNSSYANVSSSSAATADLGQTAYQYLALSALVDVTNVSTHKVRFAVSGQASVLFRGDSTDNQTWATFVRLGDT